MQIKVIVNSDPIMSMPTPGGSSASNAPPAPGGGGAPGGEKKGSSREGMLAVNDLTYVLPPDLSVSVNRTHKNHFFQSTEYKNSQRAICILNSGADYGDMRQSTLNFSIALQVPANVATTDRSSAIFGKNGSAINYIKNLLVTSRSGDELCRLTDLNHLSATIMGFKYDGQWHNTVGQAMGVATGTRGGSTDTGEVLVRYSIPMYCLTELFAYKRLLPAALLAGMRIEIDWAPPSEAFAVGEEKTGLALAAAPRTTAEIKSYSIKQLYVSMFSVQLTDGTQRALNEMSAVNGLEIVYCDYERTEQNIQSNSSSHVEVRKAASRALKAFANVRLTDDVGQWKKDSLATAPWDVSQWQWQLGALYFPQQPVKSPPATVTDSLNETYTHALIAFERYKPDGKCAAVPFNGTTNYLENPFGNIEGDALDTTGRRSVTMYDGTYNAEAKHDGLGLAETSAGRRGTFSNGHSTICCLLERTDLFNLTGVPINNARVLALRTSHEGAVAHTITIFLKYVRLARVFLNNVEVEQ